MSQSSIFESERAKNAAIDAVEANASPTWLELATEAVRWICQNKPTFTTDDVWERLAAVTKMAPHEPRAMGAVMRQAARENWCTATGNYKKSVQPSCHRRPIAVWVSLI